MPLGILLELHGWWHILTAIAAYSFIAQIEFLTGPENEESRGLGFAWPAKAVLEDIVPQKIADVVANGAPFSNGHVNGNLRKKDD